MGGGPLKVRVGFWGLLYMILYYLLCRCRDYRQIILVCSDPPPPPHSSMTWELFFDEWVCRLCATRRISRCLIDVHDLRIRQPSGLV